MRSAVFKEFGEGFAVGSSLLIALLLGLLPMPYWLHSYRPAWVLLTLVFWALTLPGRLSIVLAWVFGIFLDVLDGTLLGEHALALTAVIYLAARLHNQLRMFSLIQQGMAVLGLVTLYLFILFCVQGFLGNLPESWVYWAPALTSMLLWPWIFILLRDWYRRFET